MPEEPNNNNNNNNNEPAGLPPRRISLGFILIVLLTVGLISILIFNLFRNRDNSKHLTLNTYVNSLVNGRVETATVTHHYGSDRVTLTGNFIHTDGVKYTYTFETDKPTYESTE